MCRLRYNAEDSDEDSAACNKDSAKGHPWGEDIAKKEAGEEGVPKERDCA